MFYTFSYWSLYLLFTFNFFPKTLISSALINQTENLALLKFKEAITRDPYGILVSWNSSTHFCNWHGITCSPMHQRVTELNLQGYQFHGSISPHVGNLSFLTNLNLENNNLFGKIPQELGRLLRLKQLLLTNNSMTGEIPTNLTNCFNLNYLSLRGNNLIGNIPVQIGSLQRLQTLSFTQNKLTGVLPQLLGNLSSLIALGVGHNNFEGYIPKELCRLKKLTIISMPSNRFSGKFPFCLYNISSLIAISAAVNHFDGSLPPNMFHTLPNIQSFAFGMNRISGQIPSSISNASTMRIIDISQNHFVGKVPCLGKLQDIQRLNFENNNLGDNSTKDLEFLKSLTNCSKLYQLSIANNNFGGSLSSSIGNLSTRVGRLYLAGNHISGQIPVELGNLINLVLLSLQVNHLEGTIPASFGKLQKMQILILSKNNLWGDIPPSVGNLSQLYYLSLEDNMFQGNIPPSIGNCQELQYLDLSQNNLKGSMPLEVFSISSLSILLNLSQNLLSGRLPKEVGRLKNINRLDVSENHMFGDIPREIGECISLEYVHLQGNFFHGIIPSSLAFLKGLRYLNLSRNQLSGQIPHVLQNISFLEHLDVSFNMLEGEVPTKGIFGNASKLALIGNNKLCGGVSQLHLSPCLVKGVRPKKHHNFRLTALIVTMLAFLLMLACTLIIYWKRKHNKKRPSADSQKVDQLAKVSYQELHQGTDGFSATNWIGSGSFGSVYKGKLVSEDKFVAVKVFNLQTQGAHKSFIAECNALKNIRHRNLVKILTCCSSTTYNGHEFKALVFEYMNNGSLEEWLYPNIASTVELSKTLNLDQRLNIIIDIASALHYLHHECEQVVLHCDLKPSNILLDNDMVAHVSDFGIARLVSVIDSTSSQKETSTIGIKGTIGYAPPEYGMGSEVSTYGDMYSFGMLVLEMLTGRRPTDEMFEDGQNLHNFVAVSFPDNLVDILDPHLLPRDKEEVIIGDGNNDNVISLVENWLVSLFQIGLVCSVESPKERMNIVDVTRELNIIRKTFFAGETN